MMTRQEQIAAWVQRVFEGDSIATAGPERTFRFVEEAVELAQAVGLPPDGLKRLIDYVYERPKGTPRQEVGGCFVTLYAACEALGINGDLEADKEIDRIQDPAIVERVRGRQAEKRKLLEQLPAQNRPSPRLCGEHGGMGFTEDCIKCRDFEARR